jgi:hypothetical protein
VAVAFEQAVAGGFNRYEHWKCSAGISTNPDVEGAAFEGGEVRQCLFVVAPI